jgi:hypothetical protein
MKHFAFIVAYWLAGTAFAADTICFDKGNAFATSAPKGWVSNKEQAAQLGLCVVYHVKGANFDSSPAVIYPRLVATRDEGDEAIKQIIAQNTTILRRVSKSLEVSKLPAQTNASGLIFQIRHFFDGPPPNEFEAVAYHAGRQAVLLAVFSSRTRHGFESQLPKFHEFLMSIRPVSRTELEDLRRQNSLH